MTARAMGLAALALFLLLVAACGGSSGAKSPSASLTPAATAAASSPLDDFKQVLAALNARDAAGVYALLSTEARKELSNDRVASLVSRLAGEDPNFHVDLDKVAGTQMNGDQAQIEMTLVINYQGRQYPLHDVAYLVQEDGRWKLANHLSRRRSPPPDWARRPRRRAPIAPTAVLKATCWPASTCRRG